MPVTVNGEVVDDARIAAEEKALYARMERAMRNEPSHVIRARAREWARDNVIDEVLLRQARQADPELLGRLTAKIAPPKQKEITEYYKKNRPSLYRSEMAQADHIVALVNESQDESAALARIQQAEKQIAEGILFTAVEGYENLGVFPRGRMAPEFDTVIFSMRPGDTTPVFRTRFGFHIARVIHRLEAGIPDLNDIQQEIRTRLTMEKHRRAIDRYVDGMRATADIKTD